MASICWLVTSILEEEYLYLFHVYQQGHWTICVVPCYIFTQHKKMLTFKCQTSLSM